MKIRDCSNGVFIVSETLLSKRENFPVWIKCYTSPSSTKNAAGTLLYQAGFRTRKWSLLQVSCSRKRDIPVIEAGCMDDIYDALAEHLVPTAAATSSPDFGCYLHVAFQDNHGLS